jgi:hypothetical protein
MASADGSCSSRAARPLVVADGIAASIVGAEQPSPYGGSGVC